jgi:hypothetical protein
MSTRETLRDTPQSKGAESTELASPDDSASAGAPETSSSSDGTFDPYKFQTNTMPSGLRAELIAAGLPRVDPERIEDTVPPNDVAFAPHTEEIIRSTAPVVAEGPSEPTAVTRLRSRRSAGVPAPAARADRRSVSWMLAIVLVLVAGIALVALSFFNRARNAGAPYAAPAEPVAGRPAPKGTSPSATDARSLAERATPARHPQPPARPPLEAPAPSSNAGAASRDRPAASRDVLQSPGSPPTTGSDIVRPEPPPASTRKTNPFDQPFKPPVE